ncbi:ferredoxin-NAD(P)+ reductase (naphthalene dioxygenase ferredoxin-specific) [Paraburkholderia sp. RAU6.4a]|uniref:2Fe-2S iron-sulfur cluster-binding protein n=1 Tax=Paraburkholderia sp. RAU6.4a TaxID=2991067 RepID=UPI003D221BBC
MEVSILPLGRKLDVRAGDNLLDVLRSHQIPISYSCMSGRCGTCRCKVVAGRARVTGQDESVSQIAAGQPILACQTTLVESCVIELPEMDEVVVHPAKIIKATVTGLDDLTHDIKRLRLGLSKPLEYSPGQYATLQFTPHHIRPYSMAGTQDGNEAEFHIRLVPDGRVTSYVASDLKVGDAVRISGPLGTAYLRRTFDGPVVCVAGGTGLAPILSILRGMMKEGMSNLVHVYFGVRSSRDVYGIEWLHDLQTRHAALKVHVVVASAGGAHGHRSGMVTDAIANDWSHLTGWRAYVAGAPPMVEAASALFLQKGIQPDHIYADAFHASTV